MIFFILGRGWSAYLLCVFCLSAVQWIRVRAPVLIKWVCRGYLGYLLRPALAHYAFCRGPVCAPCRENCLPNWRMFEPSPNASNVAFPRHELQHCFKVVYFTKVMGSISLLASMCAVVVTSGRTRGENRLSQRFRQTRANRVTHHLYGGVVLHSTLCLARCATHAACALTLNQ